MSFQLTTQQVRDGTKSATRRLGWEFLKPGDRLMACVKCQGLGKGGKIEKIREIEVVKVGREPLTQIIPGSHGRIETGGGWAWNEVAREGFKGMSPIAFVEMFCKHMSCAPHDIVTRIEFRYVDVPPIPTAGC